MLETQFGSAVPYFSLHAAAAAKVVTLHCSTCADTAGGTLFVLTPPPPPQEMRYYGGIVVVEDSAAVGASSIFKAVDYTRLTHPSRSIIDKGLWLLLSQMIWLDFSGFDIRRLRR